MQLGYTRCSNYCLKTTQSLKKDTFESYNDGLLIEAMIIQKWNVCVSFSTKCDRHVEEFNYYKFVTDFWATLFLE